MLVKIALGAPLALFFVVFVTSPPQVVPFGVGFFGISLGWADVVRPYHFWWDVFQKFKNENHTMRLFAHEVSTEDVWKGVGSISTRMEIMEHRILMKMDLLAASLKKQLQDMAVSQEIDQLTKVVSKINEHYEYMMRAVELAQTNENITLQNSVKEALFGDCDSVRILLTEMHSIVLESMMFKKSLVELVNSNVKDNLLKDCGTQSPYEFLHEIYKTVMTTESKAMLLYSISYALQEEFDDKPKGFYNGTLWEQYQLFSNRSKRYIDVFNRVLSKTSRSIRACDPPYHRRGETFLEFERLTGNILLEKGGWWNQCTDYETASPKGIFCGHQNACTRLNHGCYGTLSECKEVGSTKWACLGDWDNLSPRRYDYVRDKLTYEKSGNLTDGCRTTTGEHDLGWGYLWKKEICSCTCVEDTYEGRGNHFVSLKEVTSNIDENMIVIGIKFIKMNNIIQLRILEGNLTALGGTQSNDWEWKTPEELSLNRELSDLKERFVFEKRNPETDSYEELRNDVDIAILTKSKRTFNLDELHAPKDHVITGVKFSQGVGKKPDNPNPIKLEIRATPFDYVKGILKPHLGSKWISRSDTKQENFVDEPTLAQVYEQPRRKIWHNHNSANPENSRSTTPDLKPNSFITLDSTSLAGDSGQTVIPLLDAIPVFSFPPVPLSGVSLIHKAEAGYGGFLSLRIFTIDRADRIKLDEEIPLLDS